MLPFAEMKFDKVRESIDRTAESIASGPFVPTPGCGGLCGVFGRGGRR